MLRWGKGGGEKEVEEDEALSWCNVRLHALAPDSPSRRIYIRVYTYTRARTCLRYLIVVHLARPSDPYNLRSAYDREGSRVSFP